MAGNTQDGQPGPDGKTLHVWGKPLEHSAVPEGSAPVTTQPPSLSEAVGSIKKEDFMNLPNTPCSRNGLLTGIATGAGIGGLRFVLKGTPVSAANWAVGFFILGSTASYEYCQYLRRAERYQMKRNIEIVSEKRRAEMKLAQQKAEEQKQQEAAKAAQKLWYKFW
jgi:cytochrome c oxidase assembly protein subunit 20